MRKRKIDRRKAVHAWHLVFFPWGRIRATNCSGHLNIGADRPRFGSGKYVTCKNCLKMRKPIGNYGRR